MFLGGDRVVLDEDIICILPKATATASKDTRRTISKAIGGGRIQAVEGVEKTLLLCEKNGRYQVYASPISSERLCLRNE
ncbi:MAG: hypothetical protein Q4E65_00505 [Clostridia bacterium]|nr:hypothetical protein [Clostridia bacterium]